MKFIKLRQNDYGFGHIEAVIIIVFVLIIGGVGYYTYHSNRLHKATFSITAPPLAAQADLELLSNSSNQIQIGWTASPTPGVTYQVLRNGTVIATTTATTYTDNNVTEDASYDYTIEAVQSGQITYQTDAISAAASSNCANEPLPQKSSSTTYPLISKATALDAATMQDTNLFQGYQNGNKQGILTPGGYIAENHIVGAPSYIQLRAYPDPNNASLRSKGITPTGSVGAGFDISTEVPASGGFDVCFKVSQGNWQHVHLVFISWPANSSWSEGENDFFEGNPQDMEIFIHPIDCNATDKTAKNYCGKNLYNNSWPIGVGNGGVHLIGARWDPVNGYRFYLDGALYAHVPIDHNVNPPIVTPNTPHHLSIQIQDITQDSTSNVSATVYWEAAYSYKPT